VVEDSSGNAGSAMAAYCAKAGIECEIYVPQDTPSEKTVQIQAYGATLRKVQGSRERTAEVATEAASKILMPVIAGIHSSSTGQKPSPLKSGSKMNWKAPDVLVLPSDTDTFFRG